MIYIVSHNQGLAHSGMAEHLAGIVAVSDGMAAAMDAAAVDSVPSDADLLLFEEYLDEDDLAGIWRLEREGLIPAVGLLRHSPLLQLDLSGDIPLSLKYLHDRGDGKPFDVLAFADRSLAAMLAPIVPSPVCWLPHCLSVPQRQSIERVRRSRQPDQLLCRMPMTLPDDNTYYRHKNPFCQIAAVAAVASLGQPLPRVAITFASQTLELFAARLGVRLDVTGSLSGGDYEAHLSRVAVMLCASLSESFSYNALEAMLAGIPTIFTPTVAWAWNVPELADAAGITDPGSVEQIAEKLARLLDMPANGKIAEIAAQAAAATVEENHRAARESLERLGAQFARPGRGWPTSAPPTARIVPGPQSPASSRTPRTDHARTGAPECVLAARMFRLDDLLTEPVADALLERSLTGLDGVQEDCAFDLESDEFAAALAQLIPLAAEIVQADDLTGKIEYRLVSYRHGQCGPLTASAGPNGPANAVTFDYFLHRRPRAFTGAVLRIFDLALKGEGIGCAPTFRDIHPMHDTLVMYPASAWREVTPVHCPSRDRADGYFSVHGRLT